jgi:MSHA biogenesis protein MshM
VGTGKTILCRRFLDILQRRGIVTAYVPNPAIAPRSLLQVFAEELGMFETSGLDEYTLLGNINKTLMQVAARGCSVVLCLDEAQAMPRETLEAVRLLSNLETGQAKLLQLVLFGQPELDQKLAEHSLRQLQQRITFEYEMSGMNLRELDRYVAHRLKIAGHEAGDLFSAAAIDRLHQATRGVPRLVNILCHKALMIVFGEGGSRVLPRHIRVAAADTTAARVPGYVPMWLKQPGTWTSSMGWGR